MLKANERQIRRGLDKLSIFLPAADFCEVSYKEVKNNNRFLFYYNNTLYVNLLRDIPNIPKEAIVIPILKQYMQNENIHMDLVDDYINLLLKDCTTIQYSHSMIRVLDIMMIKNIAQINETTIANYKSLDRIIPKFKEAVIQGCITVTLAIDLARLHDLSQYDLYKKLKRNGIDICKSKVDSKLLAIFINEKILSL